MAEFCRDCSIEVFGEDMKDLAGLSTQEDTNAGLFASVICEGCGFIQVNHEGVCVTVGCLKKHGAENEIEAKVAPSATEGSSAEQG